MYEVPSKNWAFFRTVLSEWDVFSFFLTLSLLYTLYVHVISASKSFSWDSPRKLASPWKISRFGQLPRSTVFQNWAFAAFAIFSNQTSNKALLCTSWWLYPVFHFWEAASPCWPHNMEPSKATWKAGKLSPCESPFLFLLSCSDRWIRTSKMVVFQAVLQNREESRRLAYNSQTFSLFSNRSVPMLKTSNWQYVFGTSATEVQDPLWILITFSILLGRFLQTAVYLSIKS